MVASSEDAQEPTERAGGGPAAGMPRPESDGLSEQKKKDPELQPKTSGAALGLTTPATGLWKVRVQVQDVLEKILDFRAERKKKRGKPHKSEQEQGPLWCTAPQIDDQPCQDLEVKILVVMMQSWLHRGMVSDQGSVNCLDPGQ